MLNLSAGAPLNKSLCLATHLAGELHHIVIMRLCCLAEQTVIFRSGQLLKATAAQRGLLSARYVTAGSSVALELTTSGSGVPPPLNGSLALRMSCQSVCAAIGILSIKEWSSDMISILDKAACPAEQEWAFEVRGDAPTATAPVTAKSGSNATLQCPAGTRTLSTQ